MADFIIVILLCIAFFASIIGVFVVPHLKFRALIKELTKVESDD